MTEEVRKSVWQSHWVKKKEEERWQKNLFRMLTILHHHKGGLRNDSKKCCWNAIRVLDWWLREPNKRHLRSQICLQVVDIRRLLLSDLAQLWYNLKFRFVLLFFLVNFTFVYHKKAQKRSEETWKTTYLACWLSLVPSDSTKAPFPKKKHSTKSTNAAARLWSNLIKRLKSLSLCCFSPFVVICQVSYLLFSRFSFFKAKLQLQSVMELRFSPSHNTILSQGAPALQYCSNLRCNRLECLLLAGSVLAVANSPEIGSKFFNSRFLAMPIFTY